MTGLTKKLAFYGAIFMPQFGLGWLYQFYHALGLFCVALVAQFSETKQIKIAGYSMIFGILTFSGSLYAMTFTGIKLLGVITPIGGVAFILAWLLLAFSIKKI